MDYPDGVPPIQRRNSIAGPFMRPTASLPGQGHSGLTQSTGMSPPTTSSNVPPPLSRASTYSGWFSGFWTSRPRMTSSGTTPSRPIPIIKPVDDYAHLSASAGDAITSTSTSPTNDNRSALLSSTGGPHRSNSLSGAGNSPPTPRRLSESGTFTRPGASAAAAAGGEQAGSGSILETDIRQGPIETDLFWLVLRDIGE